MNFCPIVGSILPFRCFNHAMIRNIRQMFDASHIVYHSMYWSASQGKFVFHFEVNVSVQF